MEEEDREEQVMSEVHLGCPPRFASPYVSHFTLAVAAHNDAQNSDHLLVEDASCQPLSSDKDGDLILNRRKNNHQRCLTYGLTIQHRITSTLRDVGLQVWRAALVLTDFVLHKSFISSDFNDITAVELGAGTGIVGLAVARVARTVFITDRGAEVLDNCATNASLNSGLLNYRDSSVRIRELDWKDSWPPSVGASDFSSRQSSRYLWTPSEIEEAERGALLLAADVVYSDELTDAFFSILEKLMSRGSEKVLYLALEKRFNFSLQELDTVANGYSHFRSFFKDCDELKGCQETSLPCFIGKQIDLATIPQYIREYERGKDIELWKITYRLKGLSSYVSSS